MTAWFGSKATSSLSQAIIAAMPPHDVYIEPFLGGGAIMKRKPPAIRNIGIDLRALEGFDDAAHVALLTLLKSLDCQVMISGYPSRLYDTHLAGWRSMSLQVNNHAAVVTETVWFKLAPDRLQDGAGLQAFVVNLLSLRRAVALIHAISGLKLSEAPASATCAALMTPSCHGRRPPSRTSWNARPCMPTRPASGSTAGRNGSTSSPTGP
ncbi:MAG: hypothetical protein OXC93_16555 [Rhodospirillaceae bacterium]|nr:hypothetical protein [Rhodospirillaceae bacterium]